MTEPLWCDVRGHYCRCHDYGKRCDDIIEECAEAVEGCLKERQPSAFYAGIIRKLKASSTDGDIGEPR